MLMTIRKNPLLMNRIKLSAVLGLSMLLSLALIVFRIHYSQSPVFRFLLWNLFLAAIPFGISTALLLLPKRLLSQGLLAVAGSVWLLFFPNAPYILTDLFHLHPRSGIPLWFDLILLLSFAWNGLMLGFISLKDMQEILSEKFGAISGWFFCGFSLFLGSFGIYLGRYLRWNSWEIFTNPQPLLIDILDRIQDPMTHPRTVGMTLLFSAFLFLSYLTLKVLISAPAESTQMPAGNQLPKNSSDN